MDEQETDLWRDSLIVLLIWPSEPLEGGVGEKGGKIKSRGDVDGRKRTDNYYSLATFFSCL